MNHIVRRRKVYLLLIRVSRGTVYTKNGFHVLMIKKTVSYTWIPVITLIPVIPVFTGINGIKYWYIPFETIFVINVRGICLILIRIWFIHFTFYIIYIWIYVQGTGWPLKHGRGLASIHYCTVVKTSLIFYKVPEQHGHVYLVGLYLSLTCK